MTEVRCSVDSCKYWGVGDVCEADVIWVKNNMRGDADDDFMASQVEAASDWGEVKSRRKAAQTSAETCCETMRPRQ